MKFTAFLIALLINGMFIITYYFGEVLSGYQTILIVSSLFVASIYNCFKNIKINIFNKTNLVLLAFFIFIFISNFWSKSPVYGLFKTQGFLLTVIIPAFAINILMKDNNLLNKVINVALIFSVIGSILLLYNNIENLFSGRTSIDGVNTIWISRYIGVGFVILYSRIRQYKTTLFNIFLIILLGISMIINGSRGPILSLFLTIYIFELITFYHSKRKDRNFIYITLVTIIIIISLFIFQEQISRFNIEFLKSDTNVSERINNYNISLNAIKDKFFIGHGIGGFSYIFKNIDDRIYPHNMILEIFVELGLIGISFLIYLIVHSFKVLNYKKENKIIFSCFSILIYYFINSMFSGDLFGNSSFFIVLIILNVYIDNKETKYKYCNYK